MDAREIASVAEVDWAGRAYVRGRLEAAARNGLDQAHLDLLADYLRSRRTTNVDLAVASDLGALMGRLRGV